ncbi:MAG: ATP-binding protein [Dehalococcoidia bacterium]
MSGRSPGEIEAVLGPIAEGSPLALAATEGEAHLVLYANPAFGRLCSRAVAGVIGRPLAEALPESHARDAEALLDRVYETGAARQAADIGPAHIEPGGTYGSYTVWPIFGAGGRPVGLLVQVSDTTDQVRADERAAAATTEIRDVNQRLLVAGLDAQEQAETQTALNAALRATTEALRQSEKRYRRLFDSIDEGFCVIEKVDGDAGRPLDFRYLEANPAFAAQSGVGDVVGKTIRQAFPGEPEEWFETYDAILRTGEPRRFERGLVTQGRVLELYAFRVEDETHGRVAVIFQDITERKRTEEALQEQMQVHVILNTALRETAEVRDQALADTQAALRVRDDFLGSISHDLRTPLSSIKGLTQLLTRQAGRSATLDSAQLAPILTTIDAATRKMATMIDELLDVTRLNAGQILELDRQPTDLVPLVQAAVAECQRTTDEHRVVISTVVPALVGEWDAVRLDRVVANLLSNAVKYSPQGGTITVMVMAETTGADAWATFTVQDRGVGVSATDLPHIFDRFHRGANVSGHIGGIGIGLAGCKQIVEQHGGGIAVASEEGVGTTVTVRLPCDSPDEPPRAVVES